MGRRKPIDFARLRGLIKPGDALRLVDWQEVWRRGELARGPCPIHRSRPESRSLAITDRVCYCHKCHFSGDAVAIWTRLTGLDVLSAAYDLCERLNIRPPLLGSSF